MPTSLAEQLQKLSAPQSSVYHDDKKRVSLLFDPKEAATKDRETFYEIGLSGLQSLSGLDDAFRLFEDSLFSLASKEFERAVQSREANENLDKTIEKFLMILSPYFQLHSAHKALEWLVNRFHIHQYNQDAIMGLILPYHETKIFVRFVQIMDIRQNTNKWHYLLPIQKSGVSLSKQALYNHCSTHPSLFKFICKNTRDYVQEFGERASKLTTVFSFFCSTVIGVINVSHKKSEAIIGAILPTLMKALVSPIDDFRASGYIVIGYVTTKISLRESTLQELISRILSAEFALTYDMVLLVNLIYSTQTHLKSVSKDFLYDLTPDRLQEICSYLSKLILQKVNVMVFVLKFMQSIVTLIQRDMEEFRRLRLLPEIIVSDLNLSSQQPTDFIKCVIKSFNPSKYKDSDGNESDLEIIEEDQIFCNDMTEWYSALLKSLERKYPEEFDKVVKSEFTKNHKSDHEHSQLARILGFKPAVAHKVGDSYLFENLNHPNATMRIEAVKYIATEFSALKSADIIFLKDSIMKCFGDEESEVVSVVLKIPINYIEEILSPQELTDCFVTAVSKKRGKGKKWKTVVDRAINEFCSLESLQVNQEVLIALLPYLFPSDSKSALTAELIIKSVWGQKCPLVKLTGNNFKLKNISQDDIHEKILESVISSLENIEPNKLGIQDYNKVDKNDTLNLCLCLYVKSFTLNEASTEESTQFLKNIIDFVERRDIVLSDQETNMSGAVMVECIKLCDEGKILFQMLEHLFEKIIESIRVEEVSKPWYNVCNSAEGLLIKQMFEICITGLEIGQYSKIYCSLLQKLLNKTCSKTREKIEFMANFACGHILVAEKLEAIISPELQLRSLKLINQCIEQMSVENCSWIPNSTIVITLLLNLNNPLSFIRQCAMNTMKTIIEKNEGKKSELTVFLNALLSRKQEILLDHEQIHQILYLILSNDASARNNFDKETKAKLKRYLNKLIETIKNPDIPAYITSELLTILKLINTQEIFTEIAMVAERLQQESENVSLEVYKSKLLRSIYGRINSETAKTLKTDKVWKIFKNGLKQYKECVMNEYESFVSPCLLILKQFDDEIFNTISESTATELISLISAASTFSNHPDIVSVASKFIKKINLNLKHFKHILQAMVDVKDVKADNTKKRALSMLSYQTAETNEWKHGTTILEYIQSKKKLTVDDSFMPLLFKLLQKCLDFEEQSYVEYTKQLILSSIWFYCKKYVSHQMFIGSKIELKAIRLGFDIELVVKCIRGTQNPQTHHHALMLLSQAAYILPEQVLNHTMAIFTFIGSSVLCHDDEYSFKIIVKIIETIVPILVKLDKLEDYSNDKGVKQLQARVVPLLRIFADVVLDVPEHRRLMLYKKLIDTLGARHFLWVFIALLLETHLMHWNESKEKVPSNKRSLAEQEMPINRLDFGQNLVLEFPPEVVLENYIKLMDYLKSLPVKKDENMMETEVNPADIFSVTGHSPLQLRHYKYTIVTFMNSCLSSPFFVQHTQGVTDFASVERLYKTFIINILMFITNVSKIEDETNAKYWKVMLHHSYDLLDNVNNLLSAPMFVSVIRGLLSHTLHTVRRKAMELLNTKIQQTPEMFAECDKKLVYSLLPALMEIVKTIDNEEEVPENIALKIELNQQMALLSLKLMTRMLAAEDPTSFKVILECITEYVCKTNISANVMASLVLCLAELCVNLKAYAISCLPKCMPALIKVLKNQRKVETPELVMLSSITAVSKIVESLPLFLSPYLKKILYEYSILLARWLKLDQESSKDSAVVTKLISIKKKIASSVAPRVLIPVASQCYQMHIKKGKLDAIGPVMSVLAESFAFVTTADFTALQQDLTSFFLSALQLRSDYSSSTDAETLDNAEDEVVNAVVSLVLKLSETSFRPFYFRIYDWAIRTNVDNDKDRAITFYRLSSAIADKLKGLFVLFAGHFIHNAAQLLDECNNSKSETLYYDSERKCATLVEHILRTLHVVFLYDSQNFVNKDRFETLMQPVVDQLENTLCGVEALRTRCKELVRPCIAQFAVAIADDSLWKPLNYQILIKTRHNDPEIRMLALECLVSMATQLGSSWLPLLAESVPFLAELLEDGGDTEKAAKDAIRSLEAILGEPLQKYF